MQQGKVRDLTMIAFFAALTGVFSQIYLPLFFTPIPINLALLAPLLAGGLLGSKKAAVSQLVYILVGAIGIPVFAGFQGGVQALVGPTGGYIVGYLCIALISGGIPYQKEPKAWINAGYMILGVIACYGLGTLWFMFLMKTAFLQSLTLCVMPFVAGDVFKITVGVLLVQRLEKPLARLRA